eukprot:712922_1
MLSTLLILHSYLLVSIHYPHRPTAVRQTSNNNPASFPVNIYRYVDRSAAGHVSHLLLLLLFWLWLLSCLDPQFMASTTHIELDIAMTELRVDGMIERSVERNVS